MEYTDECGVDDCGPEYSGDTGEGAAVRDFTPKHREDASSGSLKSCTTTSSRDICCSTDRVADGKDACWCGWEDHTTTLSTPKVKSHVCMGGDSSGLDANYPTPATVGWRRPSDPTGSVRGGGGGWVGLDSPNLKTRQTHEKFYCLRQCTSKRG